MLVSVETKVIVVAGVEIFQDEHERYNLNALHRSSGMGDDSSKAPNQWLRRKSTKALILELETQTVDLPCGLVNVINGGDRHGTYAHEILAVEYAGWISPAFRIKVNQAFIDSKKTTRMPVVSDPHIKMMIDMLVEQDQLKQRVVMIEDKERERDRQLIQQQADIIKALQQSKMALEQSRYMTFDEYINSNGLVRQFPRNMWGEAGKWLVHFCREHGMRVDKVATPWKPWGYENEYPMPALSAWLNHARRNFGQINIDGISEDGVWYED